MNVREYSQRKRFLFPPNIKDKIPDDHLAVIIDDIVEGLNLTAIYDKVPLEGNPSYHPKMMLKVLIYAYATGTFSSRKIAKALYEGIPYIYLSGWQTPDFRTISDFRKNNLKIFASLFNQVIALCEGLGMIKLGHIAIDGTKIKANASDEKSYDQKGIDRQIDRLLKHAEAIDEQEDALYGLDSDGTEIPEQVRNRDARIKRLQELKEKLRKEDTKQINTTDPDANFMKTSSGIRTSYNAQAAVDEAHNVIVANDVVTDPNDINQLTNMVDKCIENTGKRMGAVSADSGYFSGDNLGQISKKEINAFIPDCNFQSDVRKGKSCEQDPFHKDNFIYNEKEDNYTCPNGRKLYFRSYQKRKNKEPLRIYRCSTCKSCPFFNQCTSYKKGRTISRNPYEEQIQAMRKKLRSPEGKQIYAKRKQIVEPVFGIIKNVLGFRTFSLRGKEKVRGEFNVVSIAYNIKKIFSFVKAQDRYVFDLRNSLKYHTG